MGLHRTCVLGCVMLLMPTPGCFNPLIHPEGASRSPVRWELDPANPVIKPGFNGDLDARRASAPHVIRVDEEYRMYYWATGSDGHNRICVAEAKDEGISAWEPRGSVLERQAETEHNHVGPAFPHVVPRDDGPWLMFVTSWGKPRPDIPLYNRTCLALSHDNGRSWTYTGDKPVIPLDKPYDKEATGSIWVLRQGNGFRMYYTAIGDFYPRPRGVRTGHGERIPDIGIGYAVSQDGIHWTKPYHHWLVSPRRFQVRPYEYICSKPCITQEAGGYRMWVNTYGTAYRVRSLTSSDGSFWDWVESGPEGELGIGPEGAWDGVQRSYICVIEAGGKYHAWFTGNRFGATGIGHATSDLSARR